MQFTEMGKQDGKTLLLLPGTACTWQINFDRSDSLGWGNVQFRRLRFRMDDAAADITKVSSSNRSGQAVLN